MWTLTGTGTIHKQHNHHRTTLYHAHQSSPLLPILCTYFTSLSSPIKSLSYSSRQSSSSDWKTSLNALLPISLCPFTYESYIFLLVKTRQTAYSWLKSRTTKVWFTVFLILLLTSYLQPMSWDINIGTCSLCLRTLTFPVHYNKDVVDHKAHRLLVRA